MDSIEKIFPYVGLKNSVEKDFCELDGKKIDLVFSSEKTKGVYDIATMSMRGIYSCLNLGNVHAKDKLIGNIVSPFSAIIYLTDNTKTEYGKKMLRRSMVRFCVSGVERSPEIFIDRVYHHNPERIGSFEYADYKMGYDERSIQETFKLYIATNLTCNIKVSCSFGMVSKNHLTIPYDKNLNHVSTKYVYNDHSIPMTPSVCFELLKKKFAEK
jgi:hypothetical protein